MTLHQRILASRLEQIAADLRDVAQYREAPLHVVEAVPEHLETLREIERELENG